MKIFVVILLLILVVSAFMLGFIAGRYFTLRAYEKIIAELEIRTDKIEALTDKNRDFLLKIASEIFPNEHQVPEILTFLKEYYLKEQSTE